ncbi:hypothetical protein ABID82_007302 [Methylobacterium sp. PvP062]|uniref:hypothetical protein n=1 Tax=Methylobacterium TaxID=407 RepID=UPI001AE5A7C1|nr:MULTISPECIES: hypothetical protein [unclassified Methylobacterium]MBP2494669.1 hypothetical protein [Methylobacterium sp. PvP105]MBP2505460.1 hypothetical protein [Methylobacterium sp. PvP109]MCX7336132.1 hypothetical protein [Hyphomicrobiales bacterium]
MRLDGYFEILRAYLAAGLRRLQGWSLWLPELLGVLANLADPAMPESIWRPREWLPRLWSRGGHADLHPPAGAPGSPPGRRDS